MGDEIKEQGLEKEKTGLPCLPKTEYLKIVGRGRTIYSFYYPKCYVTSLTYMAMLCCPITEILVQLIDFIIRLLVYEGSIEKGLIYAHYRAKPCLNAFFCNIIHLYDWAYLAFVFFF